MVRTPAVLPLLLLCAFGATLANDTAPWPGYLGPTRDGRADAEGLFDGKRPVGLEIAWRKPLSTPAVGDGSVYALGPKGRLVALDAANGKLRWSRDVVDDLGARPPRFGVTTSPLLVGELLIVQVGKSNNRTACAFLRDSGEIQWCTGDSALGYQSPVFTSLMQREQIVAVSDTELLGIESETGYALYAFSGTAEKPTVEKVWENAQLKKSFDLPVHHDGFIYGHSRNTFLCLDAANGEMKWRTQTPGEGEAICAT